MKLDVSTLDTDTFQKVFTEVVDGMCEIQETHMEGLAKSLGVSFAMFAAKEAMAIQLAAIFACMTMEDAEESILTFAEDIASRVEAIKGMQ